jgi:hypothetical protein
MTVVTAIKNGFASSKCIYPLPRPPEADQPQADAGEGGGEGAKCGAPPSL